jgi:hypothetical protein
MRDNAILLLTTVESGHEWKRTDPRIRVKYSSFMLSEIVRNNFFIIGVLFLDEASSPIRITGILLVTSFESGKQKSNTKLARARARAYIYICVCVCVCVCMYVYVHTHIYKRTRMLTPLSTAVKLFALCN